MSVLVTGATGFLGRHLLAALHVPTVALVRDRSVQLGVELVDEVPRGTRTIVHAAALVRHSRRGADEVMQVNVEGTREIVRAAARVGARVVLVSTTGTVGCFRRGGVVADEHSPYSPLIERWPYYLSKLRAEREAVRLAGQLGVELAIVRLPALLGPGDHRRRSTAHVARVLAHQVPFVPTGGISFADVRDVARAIARLATSRATRAIYHLPGTDVTLARFFQMVGEVAGLAVRRRHAPAWLVAGLARLRLRSLPDPVVLEMANHHWGVASLWSQRELGYASRPARQTLMDTVADLTSGR